MLTTRNLEEKKSLNSTHCLLTVLHEDTGFQLTFINFFLLNKWWWWRWCCELSGVDK